jgi:filamentous hemagglutinin family protein
MRASLTLLKLLGCVATTSSFLLGLPSVLAQLIPDNTLGIENSRITTQDMRDLIEGGARRGHNLFHSFQEFNIGNQQQVYFANPQGITNIITRVTGKNVSNIFGTLGVDGVANLFFINPNGIIFRTGARLDVLGSFVASTADGITLGEDGFFSATDPEKSTLLSIQPGVLFSHSLRQQQAAIRNQGNLSVGVGQTLTLQADTVTNTGSLIAPGGTVEMLANDILIEPGSAAGLAVSQSFFANNVILQAHNDIIVDDRIFGSVNNLTMLAGRSLTIGNNGNILLNGGDFNVKINDENIDFSKRDAGVAQFVMNPGSQILTNGGNVTIASGSLGQTSQINTANAAIITANTVSNGGNITLSALGDIRTGLLDSRSGAGNAGDITVSSYGGAIATTNAISADSLFQAGNILLDAAGDLNINGGNVTSYGVSAGKITLTSGGILSSEGINIANNILGSGNPNPISLTAQSILLNNSTVLAGTASQSRGGDMQIEAADKVVLRNSNVATFAYAGSGNAGNLNLNARQLVIIKEPGVRAPLPLGIDITLNLPVLGAVGLGTIAIPPSSGNGGDLTINAFESVEVLGQQPGAFTPIPEQLGSILIQTDTGISTSAYGSGNSGNLTINTGRLVVRDKAGITTFPVAGKGGDLSVNATEIFLQGQGGLGTATLGLDAGNLKVKADRITVTDGAVMGTTTFGLGNASDFALSVGQLRVLNGSLVGTSTVGMGNGGIMTINASDLIEVAGTSKDGYLRSGIATNSYTLAKGNAGAVNIATNQLIVRQGGEISTATVGEGEGGDIQIDTRILLLENGRINASTAAFGKGGDITIRAKESVEVIGTGFNALQQRIIIPAFEGTLSLNNFDQGVITVTGGKGAAGNVLIESPNFVTREGGLIATTTLGQGEGGNVTINSSDNLELDSSLIGTGTFTDAPSGDVYLNTRKLIAVGGAQVLTTTFGDGKAGDLTVNVLDSIDLIDPNNQGRLLTSGLFASSVQTASGNGGDININIPTSDLNIQDGASVSVSAAGEGNAGDININARSISLNRGSITATSISGEGGNINLNVADNLILRNNSLISTRAGTEESGGGNGGNINIKAQFIAAVPHENSDITANAFQGNGGDINIKTQGIFGFYLSDRPTLNSEITASSQLGVDGTIDIQTSEIDPSKGLTELPSNVTNPSNRIVAGCSIERGDRFVITGGGGLPENPTQYLLGQVIVQDTRNLSQMNLSTQPIVTTPFPPEDYSLGTSEAGDLLSRGEEMTKVILQREVTEKQFVITSEQPLIEAQGWIVDEDGTVILTAEPLREGVANSWVSAQFCEER